jgi:hypothetical protein
MSSRFICTALALAGLFLSVESEAVGTRRFQLREGKDFEGGDIQGVAIDSTGKVRAGFDLGKTLIPEAASIWSGLVAKDGSLLFGTGNDGKLLKFDGTKATVVGETKSLAVTSLVEAWGGSVLAGTLPEGKLFKWEKDKLTEFVKLEKTEHVWQLAFDPKSKSVFAATGPEGKLWRIPERGAPQVYFDAEEQHLMSVAVAPDGTVFAGASDRAKLYKITGPGRATVFHDFARTEVRGIAIAPKGDVYAIANEIQGGTTVPPKKPTGDSPAAPAPNATKTRGQGVLFHFTPDGTPDQLLEDTKQHFTSLVIGKDGQPYVGTGAEGQVYTVDSTHATVLVADTDARQLGAVVLGGAKEYVLASDPAAVQPIKQVGGPDAVWTSKVLDAGLRASFGRLSWDADGVLELQTRSGNTKEADDTWSEWSPAYAGPTEVKSPPARYLQVRAKWTRDPKAVLREVEIPFVTENLRAVATAITAETAARPSGSADGMEKSGEPVSRSADTKVKLSWRIDNPDRDELRFRLEYRLEGTSQWFDLLQPGEILTKSDYSWETREFPEGRYRIRVTVSDEISNPPGRVKTHQLVSNLIVVDNSAPSIEGLEVTGRRVRARLVDGIGPIDRIELSRVGTGEWVPFYPADGIFDEANEDLDADVSGVVPAGPALLTLRVYDRAANFVVRSVMVK